MLSLSFNLKLNTMKKTKKDAEEVVVFSKDEYEDMLKTDKEILEILSELLEVIEELERRLEIKLKETT
jgi:PHD/YefM family antitoxin component YafN of YafNO toxin-antitoxin module